MHSFCTSSGDTDINVFSGEIRWTGRNLHRPECVLATASGDVFAADWQGGVTHIRSDGRQLTYLAQPVDGMRLQPNGVALLRDGSSLIAHLGPEQGAVFRLERDGTTLAEAVFNYWDRAHRARMFSLRLRPYPVNSTQEHMALVERIRQGDAAGAAKVNLEHRRRASRELLAIFERYRLLQM